VGAVALQWPARGCAFSDLESRNRRALRGTRSRQGERACSWIIRTPRARPAAGADARIGGANRLPEHFALPTAVGMDRTPTRGIACPADERAQQCERLTSIRTVHASRKRLLYTTPDASGRWTWRSKQRRQVVSGRVRLIEAGRKNERVYYVRGGRRVDRIDSRPVAQDRGAAPARRIVTVQSRRGVCWPAVTSGH